MTTAIGGETPTTTPISAPDLRALRDPARRDAILSDPKTTQWLVLNHPGWWFALFGYIVDTRNRLRAVVGIDTETGKPFEGVNWLQWQFFEAATWFYHHDIPFRGIGLKPRQTGLSTAVQAYLYWRHRLTGCRSITIADKDETGNTVQQIFRTFCQNDRFPWGSTVREANQVFTFPNGSMAARRTMRAANVGRGGNPLMQHRTEVAHFLEGEKIDATAILAGASASTSLVPGSFIMDESTPNGRGNFFAFEYLGNPMGDSPELREPAVTFDDWKEGKRGNGYVKFYAPWFRFLSNDDKQASDAELAKIKATLSEKEINLIRAYRLTLSQISWRRKKIAEFKSESVFIQEETEDELLSFLLAGRPFFDAIEVERLVTIARAITPQIGDLVRQPNKKVHFRVNPQGRFYIWEHPTFDYKYLFSADTMTGASQVKDASKCDTHSALMWRSYVRKETEFGMKTLSPMLVARVAPGFQDDAGPALELVSLLLDYYGGPLACPEANNSGGTWVMRLPEMGHAVCHSEGDPLDPGQKAQTRRGWFTTPKTRRPILDALADKVRERDIHIPCLTMLSQMQTFVHHSDGSISAASGNLDDDVMAAAIFAYLMPLAETTQL